MKSHLNQCFFCYSKRSSQFALGRNLHDRPLPDRYAELPERHPQNVIPNSKVLEADDEDKESPLEAANDYEALDAVRSPQQDIDDKVSPNSEAKVDLTSL